MEETIMIVDSEKDTRSAFKKILELARYKVVTVSCVKKCLDKLKKERVDLILLEILMPKLKGVMTLKKIRELYPRLKVMIITVVGNEKIKKEAIRLGIEKYFIKPIGKKKLTLAIKEVLGSS